MEPKLVILLNGPPKCGKDAMASRYIELYNEGVIMKLAQPIRDAAIATFSHLTEENFDEEKNEPVFPSKPATTLREWMIGFAESFMKPTLGVDVFARILAADISRSANNLILVTDLGFSEELDTLNPYIADPRFRVVAVDRPGTSFSGDSRYYVAGTQNNETTVPVYPFPTRETTELRTMLLIHNDRDLDNAVSHLHRIIAHFRKDEKI